MLNFYRHKKLYVFMKLLLLWSKSVFATSFPDLLYEFLFWTKKMSKNEKPFSNLEQ
jgi:hypothetical protein